MGLDDNLRWDSAAVASTAGLLVTQDIMLTTKGRAVQSDKCVFVRALC